MKQKRGFNRYLLALLLLLTIAITASCGGGGGDGTATTTTRVWGTAVLIETDNAGDAGLPQVAVDGSGNAIAVWGQSDGTRYNIWANRYVVGTGWGTAGLIETNNAGDAGYPQVAVDGSGNAIAVWGQYDGTRYNIWANSFR